jgi:hypothetical protein
VVDQQRHNCLQRRDAIRRVVPGADLVDELIAAAEEEGAPTPFQHAPRFSHCFLTPPR